MNTNLEEAENVSLSSPSSEYSEESSSSELYDSIPILNPLEGGNNILDEKKARKTHWTPQEDQILREAVAEFGERYVVNGSEKKKKTIN